MEPAGARQSISPNPAPLRLVRDASSSLPDPLSSFLGRENELAEIELRLRASRLVTLTGAGGSGKTRLAIETARRWHERVEDGAFWVDLAPVEDPALVAPAILAALGERAQTGRTAASQVATSLADREILLALDNCEHLVSECAQLVEMLLRGARRIRVLATSREALAVAGEVVWPVPTLPLATAVRLFEERAQALVPTFRVDDANSAAVSEVCRRLDGLPLAIELAAARVTALSPAQIAARLDDCFRLLGGTRRGALPRQQTLRATIDWSYALLTAEERVVLERLSVFAGGCRLAAAEAVCAADDVDALDVLTHLCALVDRSLVVADASASETRYRLLETVRQYAAERLDASGSAQATRRRHAEHFVTLVESVGVERFGRRREAAVAGMQSDIDNVRAALRWTAEHDPDLYVRLACGFGWCWFAYGLWWEGREWLERALTLPLGMRPHAHRALALSELAYLAIHQRDIARARPALEESIAIWDALGTPRERLHAQTILAQAYLFEGTPESVATALRIAEAAQRTVHEAGDTLGACWVACTLGGIHAAIGNQEESSRWYDRGRLLAYECNHPMSVGIGCMGMAAASLAKGDVAPVAALLREGLAAHRLAPEYMFLAWTIQCTALYAAARGRMADVARLLGGDEMLRRHGGAVVGLETTKPAVHAAVTGGARQALGDAGYVALLDEGRRLGVTALIDYAESIVAADAPDPPAISVPDTLRAPALRVVSLGAVRIERDGVAVPLAEWKYAKARELLFLLLLHPKGRTREQIGVALWPDVSAEQLRANLHPVLHHLRRVLGGNEWVRHEAGVYRFDRTRDYAFDAEEMEQLVTQAAASADRATGADCLARAVELYGGDFLEQDPPPRDWHIDRQDGLRRVYETALADLAAVYMDLGRWRDAAGVWRRVIARDDLNEAAYRELMRCHDRLGEHREALRVFERLTTVLRNELGSRPDAATRAVVERIQRAPV